MTAFDEALAFALRWESGYAHVPGDRGGETYRGIARNFHPTWPGWAFVDQQPDPIPRGTIFPELEPAVHAFYREHFWDAIHGDDLLPRTAIALFDWAVNSGEGSPAKFVQRLVGAKVDGDIGPKTIAALFEYMDRAAAAQINGARRASLDDRFARGKIDAKFRTGLYNRVDDLALKLA